MLGVVQHLAAEVPEQTWRARANQPLKLPARSHQDIVRHRIHGVAQVLLSSTRVPKLGTEVIGQ